jgi:Rrf2 family transcriptional regulator, cysteine metabolism repressor
VRVSAKSEYAVQALLDLALHDGQGLQPIQDIATRQRIPQRYLEQVLLQLKRAGFLESKRGSAGGYRLNRSPDQITVGAVLRAAEGPTRAEALRRGGAADPASDLAELWREIEEAVAAVTDRITFEELRRRIEARHSAARPMYYI